MSCLQTVKRFSQSPKAGYPVNRGAPQVNTSVDLKYRPLLLGLSSFLQPTRTISMQRTLRLSLQQTIAQFNYTHHIGLLTIVVFDTTCDSSTDSIITHNPYCWLLVVLTLIPLHWVLAVTINPFDGQLTRIVDHSKGLLARVVLLTNSDS